MSVFEVSKLSRSGLSDITLSLDASELVCLSGPSGAGKTLLLRALADLDESAGEVLLEYFFADRHLYLWVIGQNGLTTHRLGAVKNIRDAVVAAQTGLQRNGRADGLDALSAELVQPIAALLAENSRLRIAPDGVGMFAT